MEGHVTESSMDKPSVTNSSSTLTADDVSFLMRRANISSSDYQFLIPNQNQRANQPPDGYISVYKQQITMGLRFPLHELVVEICNRLQVSPSQLRSNAHCTIVAFILCAKLYNLPLTADYFFSLFTVMNRPGPGNEHFLFFVFVTGSVFLERKFRLGDDGWKRKFFFLKPLGKSWNCLTEWTETFSCPKVDSALISSNRNLAYKSGMFERRFRLDELIHKDLLIHGGIEPGVPSPQFTFRYLMHKAAATMSEFLPKDIPLANGANKARNKLPHSANAAPVHDIPLSSISASSSKLTEDEILYLMRRANISSTDYEFLVPSEDERANQPPKGYISVYKQQIAWGLRFPLHEIVVEICNRMKVSPSQLRSMAHCTIVGFILCAKLYNMPITADCFFSLFAAIKSPDSNELVLLHPLSGLNFLERKFSMGDGWKRKFFFLRPVRKSWNCLTKWSGSFSYPQIDAALSAPFQELAHKTGMLKHHIRLNKLIQKDVLVHGGIELGDPSPQVTFRYLMHRAAVTKFELLPQDIPPANATNKAASKRRLSANDARALNTWTDRSGTPSASKVPIPEVSPSSFEDIDPLKEFFHEGREDYTALHEKKNCPVLVSDEAQSQSLPAPLLALSKILESMYVPKECYEKLVEEKQEVISELKLTKSRVQEFTHEIELYKAKSFDSEYRTSQAMVKVNMLEKRLENAKSDSESLRDKIKKDVIDEFKSSDDFANVVHEEAVKYYMNGFETCKLRVLNSGKLPSGFNFDLLDVAGAEWGNSPGGVDNDADDLDEKPLKRKKV